MMVSVISMLQQVVPLCHRQVGRMLLDKGVSMSKLDRFGRPPLMYAALVHQPLDLFKFFLGTPSSLLYQLLFTT